MRTSTKVLLAAVLVITSTVCAITSRNRARQPTERDHRKSDGFINQRQALGTAK